MRGLKKTVFIYRGGRGEDGGGFCLQFGEGTDIIYVGAGIYFHRKSLYCKCCFCDWSWHFDFSVRVSVIELETF